LTRTGGTRRPLWNAVELEQPLSPYRTQSSAVFAWRVCACRGDCAFASAAIRSAEGPSESSGARRSTTTTRSPRDNSRSRIQPTRMPTALKARLGCVHGPTQWQLLETTSRPRCPRPLEMCEAPRAGLDARRPTNSNGEPCGRGSGPQDVRAGQPMVLLRAYA
jgi:hypothetical protein